MGLKRALVVDDSSYFRHEGKEFLEKSGFEVVTANDGTTGIEAYDAAAADGRPFALVLSDLRMDIMGGFEFYESIQDRLGKTVFVLRTSDGHLPSVRSWGAARSVAVLSKGAEIDQLEPFLP